MTRAISFSDGTMAPMVAQRRTLITATITRVRVILMHTTGIHREEAAQQGPRPLKPGEP